MFLLVIVASLVAAYGIAEVSWPSGFERRLARLSRSLGGRGEPWSWPSRPPRRWEHRLGGILALALAAWILWAGLAARGGRPPGPLPAKPGAGVAPGLPPATVWPRTGGSRASSSGTAPSNGTPWYTNSCITSARAQGALSAGVDAIGPIPEAGGVARIVGHPAGYVGVVADQFGAGMLNAVGHTGTTVQGLNGLADASPTGLLSTGLTVAGFIPGVGDAAAVLSISPDVFSTVQAVGACP